MKWKDVNGFEGYYEVSDCGIVRSVDRNVFYRNGKTKKLTGKTMKQTERKNGLRGGDGYYVVNLRRDGKSKVIPVHRIVAEAFIDNKYMLPTVNHIDGNKHNNNVSNLEWATYSHNNEHAIQTGLRSPRGNAVMQIGNNGDIISIFRSACEASRSTGISRGMISHCINHRCSYAGGYIWRKVEECNDYLLNESTVDDELPLEAQERDTEDIVCADRKLSDKR